MQMSNGRKMQIFNGYKMFLVSQAVEVFGQTCFCLYCSIKQVLDVLQ